MRLVRSLLLALILAGMGSGWSCGTAPEAGNNSIVVTYSVLGAVVKELVGDQATVTVSVPNGLDPHEWEPSAKDIETINKADLVVENGLGLETGMLKGLQEAKRRGVRVFTATDHINVRYIGELQAGPGGPDPHFWTDPVAMKAVVEALVPVLRDALGIDVAAGATDLESRLDQLGEEIAQTVATIPAADRKLVTGHESLGYFAERCGFKLVGVIIPSLSSQAEASAADLTSLQKAIESNDVRAVFTELGTSPAVAKAIGDATGVRVVELTTHAVPADGSYFTFMTNLAETICAPLRPRP